MSKAHVSKLQSLFNFTYQKVTKDPEVHKNNTKFAKKKHEIRSNRKF